MPKTINVSLDVGVTGYTLEARVDLWVQQRDIQEDVDGDHQA